MSMLELLRVAAAWSAGALGLLGLTALVQVLAAMLERSGPIRLRHWAEEAGGGLLRLYESPTRFETFRFLLSLLGRALALSVVVYLVVALPQPGLGQLGTVLGAVVGVVGLIELLNRHLVNRDPERVLRALTRPYQALHLTLSPVVLLLSALMPAEERGDNGGDDDDEASDEEIQAFLEVGEREGILDPKEGALIQRVIDFGDSRVRSVMTPRTDMVAASVETGLDDLTELFLESRHSRIPLYEDSVERIVGLLHIRDLLGAMRSADPGTARSLAMVPYVVPETKALEELLRDFQLHRQQMAIVVDEFGSTVGLVTVEDLLEEIVGEIADEHEPEAARNESLGDGSWRVDGRAPLDVLGDLFAANLDDQPYETVGGLIFGLLGHVPEPGERVLSHGLDLLVERVEDRRIQSVIARREAAAGA